MKTNNSIKIDSRTLSLEIVDNAAKSGQVLSALIAPTGVKFFCKAVIVEFKPLPAEKNVALAVALKNRGIPFCSFDKALGGTLGSIPAEHLRGEEVVAKVYPKAAPATRPVVKPGAPAPEPVKPAEEPVKLAPTAEGDLAPAPKEKKAKAPRAPRTSRAKKAKGGEAAEQAAS